jgi:hypothetical protein
MTTLKMFELKDFVGLSMVYPEPVAAAKLCKNFFKTPYMLNHIPNGYVKHL